MRAQLVRIKSVFPQFRHRYKSGMAAPEVREANPQILSGHAVRGVDVQWPEIPHKLECMHVIAGL